MDSFCNTDLTGESGKLHVTNSQGKVKIGESECLEGEMTKETRQKLDNCSGKKTVVMEKSTKNTSDSEICVSKTNQGTMKNGISLGNDTRKATLPQKRDLYWEAFHVPIKSGFSTGIFQILNQECLFYKTVFCSGT